MSGKNEHLSNLYVLRSIGGIDSHIGNVVASQGLDTLIYIGSTIVVTAETDIAEVRLNETGLQVRDADGRIGNINAQTV